MDKKPDLVVWSEEKNYYARELTYGSNLGAPAIKLDEIDGWKKNQANTLNNHFNKKYKEILDEFNSMLDEIKTNELIYKSEYNFIPVIGEIYHLYERKNKTRFLSLISPESWNQNCLGSFRLESNQKWVKIN